MAAAERVRIVFFASGSAYSRVVLEAAMPHGVVAVVVPAPRGKGWRRLLSAALLRIFGRGVRTAARRRGIPVVRFEGDVAAKLRDLRPDLICIAGFPHILPPEILGIPSIGVWNVHPGRLPQRRGSDPVFWTFFHDDAEAGVAVHWAGAGVDDGDLVAQETVPVRRGMSRHDLEAVLAGRGAALLANALASGAAGAPRIPQDPAEAHVDPMPSKARWSIDYDRWPAERVWHFLRGVGTGSLRDRNGRRIVAGEALRFVVAAHDRPPGTFDAPRLYCRDGWVELGKARLRRRLLLGVFVK